MKDPLSYCLALLKRRLRSSLELEEAMRKREVVPDKIRETIEYLKELKLVDDVAYAWAWVHTRDRLNPRGDAVLRQELMLKGIPKDIISTVLSERKELATSSEDNDQPTEEELAQAFAATKERGYARLDPETRKRRLMAALQRRGFSYGVIRRILDS